MLTVQLSSEIYLYIKVWEPKHDKSNVKICLSKQ
jgi:hypothetical protein